MEEFRLTEEELELVEKWSGQKLTKGEKLDLILKDKIFEKEDLTPEELDDILTPEEEWDDYE